MIRMIAFDLDGTIADTIPMCVKAFQESVSKYTDHALSEKEVLDTFGLNETGMVKVVVGEHWEDALHDFYEKYEWMHSAVTEPFAGIRSLMEFLKQRDIPLALITGKGERSCGISLEKLGMNQVFEEVLCGSQRAPVKREHMEFLIKKYAVPKTDFYYIGDTAEDIRACRKAGVTCLSAAWRENADSELLERENPELVFYSVDGLQNYIKKNLVS